MITLMSTLDSKSGKCISLSLDYTDNTYVIKESYADMINPDFILRRSCSKENALMNYNGFVKAMLYEIVEAAELKRIKNKLKG